jgi:DNA polymerase-1
VSAFAILERFARASIMSTPADLVLVDGSSYLYRAFHALPPLSNSRGEPTGALLGVLNMLVKFVREYRPAHIAVVFDAPGKTFRDELFTHYKAHRPAMPDDLRAQLAPLLEILRAQGLPVLRISGVEADDVIGTLACRAASAGQRVLISTGDKDMAQLVNDSITLVNTMSNSTLDRAGVKLKFDVYPEQIVDYLALVGDSSDNIPGIDMVGPKTAAKLLNQYGTLDGLVLHLDEVGGKVGENLRAGRETLELSRRLAQLRTDLELPLEPAQLRPAEPDTSQLRALYERYELRALLRQLEDATGSAERAPAATPDGAAPAPKLPRHYETLTTWPDLERWLERLRHAPLITFDTETSSLDYMRAEIVGVSFASEPGFAAYVPLHHDYAGAPEQLDRAEVLAALRPILENPGIAKVGHHLKYDAHVLLHYGIELAGVRYDTMLESYIWNSVATNHDLDGAAQRYLGVRTIKYEDVAGKGAKKLSFNEVPVDRASEYAAQDADVTLQLHNALWPQIQSVPALQSLYEEVEQPLVPILLGMEHHGVLVDRELLEKQSRDIAAHLARLLAQAQAQAGVPFNIESPKQLQQVLFEKLQLPVLRKTPTGQPSTAEDVLEELAQ